MVCASVVNPSKARFLKIKSLFLPEKIKKIEFPLVSVNELSLILIVSIVIVFVTSPSIWNGFVSLI